MHAWILKCLVSRKENIITGCAKLAIITCTTATMLANAASAREPTRADVEFCNNYSQVMQKSLEVERSGDPAAISQFRQSLSRDPQGQFLAPALGVGLTTPQWVSDVTSQSRQHCLDEVRLNRRGYLPDDPDRPAPACTPESCVVRDDRPPPSSTSVSIKSPSTGALAPAVSDAQLLKEWWVAQDACRGRPDDSICERRNHLTVALNARGYEQRRHDVWTSESDARNFYGVVQSTESWAKTQSALNRYMAGPAVLRSLRNHLSDEKVIAIWNDSHDEVRDRYPAAWEILRAQVKQIVREHSGTDPRFALDD